MITTAIILYALGIIPTLAYLMALMADIPGGELGWWHMALASVMVLGMSLAWPVFWAWLLIDMWRE